MRTDVQKSYNWAYGAVSSSLQVLPFLIKAIETKGPLKNAAPTMNRFAGRLDQTADELDTLGVHLESDGIVEAARLVRNASQDLSVGARCLGEQDAQGGLRALAQAFRSLEFAKRSLDVQTVVSYKLWFRNPWRYFPRRLSASLPPGPKGLD